MTTCHGTPWGIALPHTHLPPETMSLETRRQPKRQHRQAFPSYLEGIPVQGDEWPQGFPIVKTIHVAP